MTKSIMWENQKDLYFNNNNAVNNFCEKVRKRVLKKFFLKIKKTEITYKDKFFLWSTVLAGPLTAISYFLPNTTFSTIFIIIFLLFSLAFYGAEIIILCLFKVSIFGLFRFKKNKSKYHQKIITEIDNVENIEETISYLDKEFSFLYTNHITKDEKDRLLELTSEELNEFQKLDFNIHQSCIIKNIILKKESFNLKNLDEINKVSNSNSLDEIEGKYNSFFKKLPDNLNKNHQLKKLL